MAWTYTNNYHKNKATPNTERLISLWESFGATGLFSLEVDFMGTLTHVYSLKNTKINIMASVAEDGSINCMSIVWKRNASY